MKQRIDLERPLNPWDIIMGTCLGMQMSFVALRLASLIKGAIFLWVQIVEMMAALLLIALGTREKRDGRTTHREAVYDLEPSRGALSQHLHAFFRRVGSWSASDLHERRKYIAC